MALFSDGQINGLQDLAKYDSGILEVASAEGVDLAAKTGLAQDQIAAELLVFLLKRNNRDFSGFQCFETAAARRTLGVSDVVVTDPLKRWHALKTIALAYQDAYYSQLNDRYKGKWNQYNELASTAAQQLFEIGVGLVTNPIPMAAPPLLVSAAGSLPSATYYVRMAWVNTAGQEGSPSAVVSLTTLDGSTLIVSPGAAPANAAGWNVYVGETPEQVWLQNSAPLPTGGGWTMPSSGLQFSRMPSSGQAASRYAANNQVIPRG